MKEVDILKQHNYNYDTNRIISVSGEQGSYQIESFSLQLDHFLSSQDKLSSQTDELVNMTINLLYGLLQEQNNQEF